MVLADAGAADPPRCGVTARLPGRAGGRVEQVVKAARGPASLLLVL
jgi:hypothetical protein